MRVIHFSCVGPPEIGGVGRVAALEVAALRARGVDARLVVPEPPVPVPPEQERSWLTRLPSFRIGNGAVLYRWREQVQGADLVHLHYPFYGFAEPLLLFPHDVPVVMTFHMDAIVGGWRLPIAVLHRVLIQPILLRRAARIFVSSFDYARRSSLAGFFSTHMQRIVEAPFGVDGDTFSPGPSVRGRFSLPEGAPVLAFVGGLDRAHAFKGLPDLLHALKSLPAQVQLLIVGDGNLRQTYEELADMLDVRRQTHFLGRVDVDTLRDVYRSADLFVFPSTSRAEAFGLAALEAEACGVPVIASDWPGVRTVVLHGETGLLVPPSHPQALSQAIRQLLDDEPLRRRFSVNAATHAKGLSWEAHTDRLLATYRDVCALPS